MNGPSFEPSKEFVEAFQRDGYVLVPGLFTPKEVAQYLEHYMALRAAGAQPNDDTEIDMQAVDPLKRFPRLNQMHRWDAMSRDWLLSKRLGVALSAFVDREPYAIQTMMYYKPPGARGQALHQDQYFVRVKPGTCIAAWMALDPCDQENGCLHIVPRSHELPLLCTVDADLTQSFSDITVPLPEGMTSLPIVMQPGDVLFFNGQVIHGSYPNKSATRFRRALIGHYIAADGQKVARYYHPVLRMDGSEVILDDSLRGGPCGIWVADAGAARVELREEKTVTTAPVHP